MKWNVKKKLREKPYLLSFNDVYILHKMVVNWFFPHVCVMVEKSQKYKKHYIALQQSVLPCFFLSTPGRCSRQCIYSAATFKDLGDI